MKAIPKKESDIFDATGSYTYKDKEPSVTSNELTLFTKGMVWSFPSVELADNTSPDLTWRYSNLFEVSW